MFSRGVEHVGVEEVSLRQGKEILEMPGTFLIPVNIKQMMSRLVRNVKESLAYRARTRGKAGASVDQDFR